MKETKLFSYNGNSIDNTGIHLGFNKLDDYINNIDNVSFTGKQTIKAVLVCNTGNDLRMLYEVLDVSVNKHECINALHRACSDYFASNKCVIDGMKLKEKIEYQTVEELFKNSGVVTKSNNSVIDVLSKGFRCVRNIEEVYSQIMYIANQWSDTEYSETEFLQSVFDRLEREYLHYLEYISESKEVCYDK